MTKICHFYGASTSTLPILRIPHKSGNHWLRGEDRIRKILKNKDFAWDKNIRENLESQSWFWEFTSKEFVGEFCMRTFAPGWLESLVGSISSFRWCCHVWSESVIERRCECDPTTHPPYCRRRTSVEELVPWMFFKPIFVRHISSFIRDLGRSQLRPKRGTCPPSIWVIIFTICLLFYLIMLPSNV